MSAITVDLVTDVDFGNAQRQLDFLHQIQNRAAEMNVTFRWTFAPNLHDRSIIVDHTRWKIILGRELYIYAQWDGSDLFNPMIRHPELRPCKSCTITYLDQF